MRAGDLAAQVAASDQTASPGVVRRRITAALLLSGCLALLGVGAALQPATTGMGTHTQLGLPACAFEQYTGLPCSTCGMTTAVSLAAHGHLATAFVVQPAGALLALVAAMLAWVSGYALWRGLDVAAMLRPLWRPMTLLIVGAIVLGAWAFRMIAAWGLG